MNRRSWTSVAASLATCAIAGCLVAAWADARPKLIVGGHSGTVTINNWLPVYLSVRVFNASGRELPVKGLHYEWVSGDPVRVTDDGSVTCERHGSAEVRVSRGSVFADLQVVCRPIQHFRFTAGVRLLVGGAPQRLPLAAFGADDQPITTTSARATVRDLRIVELDDLWARPKSPGTTWIDVDIGDCIRSIDVVVSDSVASPRDLTHPYEQFVATAVRLEQHATRQWVIPAGQFELWLRPVSSEHADLVLETANANCRRIGDDAERYLCIARGGAVVTARHRSATAVTSEGAAAASADVVITRVEDPLSNVASAARYISPARSWKQNCYFVDRR